MKPKTRRTWQPRKIILNRIACLKCDTVLTSTHRHDFKECPCGAVAIDGGTDWLKRSGDLKLIHELSEFADAKRKAVAR